MIAEEKRAGEMGVADDDMVYRLIFLIFYNFFYIFTVVIVRDGVFDRWLVRLFSSFLFGLWVVFVGKSTWI